MAKVTSKKNNASIESEIQRIVENYGYNSEVLTSFANFVLNPPKLEKSKKSKLLTMAQIKKVIFDHFKVSNLTALRKSNSFQMATSGLEKLEANKKAGWEDIYRKVIGILPGEEIESGEGCINGINIFKYDMPWKAFGLDPNVHTTDDVKASYRQLCKIYHPDRPTGDADIFDRLTIFYKSLIETF